MNKFKFYESDRKIKSVEKKREKNMTSYGPPLLSKKFLSNTEFNIHCYSQKLTNIVLHLLYSDCTSFFLSLTFLYSYWPALCPTVCHCTVLLTSNVPYWTPIYRALTSTVRFCTGHWLALSSLKAIVPFIWKIKSF